MTNKKVDEKIFSAFISGSSDTNDVLEEIKTICLKLSIDLQHKIGKVLIPKFWKELAVFEALPRFQEQIFNKIGEYDVFIGVLWNRFGSSTGKINPLTGKEYESGTQEEFEDALSRKKNNEKIKTFFFFKEIDPTAPGYEANQAKKVTTFKESLMQRNVPCNPITAKIDFRTDLYRELMKWLESYTFESKTSLNIETNNWVKDLVIEDDYLEREIIEYDRILNETYSYTPHPFSLKSFELFNKHTRIVLLGDSGSGKTRELKRIIEYYLQNHKDQYPIYVKLSNYIDEQLEDILPLGWDNIPEENLILLFDGLDEIPNNTISTALKRIHTFFDKHPKIKTIFSSRTNCYISETDESTGLLNNFKPYFLQKLDWDEINRYLKKKLNTQLNNFNLYARKTEIMDLLPSPFYLKAIIELYNSNNRPTNLDEIFTTLIYKKLEYDEEHFRTTKPDLFKISNKEIFNTLSQIAIFMESLGKNSISTHELSKVLQDNELKDLIEYKSVITRYNDNWQFDHNNLQEYLSAKLLAKQDLGIIKKFITFSPLYNTLIPSWSHTVSFLFNLYDKNDIREWILDSQPELLLKFEPDKISEVIRERIFFKIFNSYKEKNIWIDRERFKYFELARFANTRNCISFLVEQLVDTNHYTVIGNTINILGNMEIPLVFKKVVKEKLLHIALHHEKHEIQNDALIALSVLGYASKKTFNQIFEKHGQSDNDWIRYGIYYVLENSTFYEDYLTYLLDGIQLANNRFSSDSSKTRIANESWHLDNVLKKIKSTRSLILLVKYLVKNPNILHMIGFDRVFEKLVDNFIQSYNSNPNRNLFNSLLDLLKIISSMYLYKPSKLLRQFFISTKTNVIVFEKLLRNKLEEDQNRILAQISNADCFNLIIDAYKNGKVTERQIWIFQGHLSNNLDNLYELFNRKLNAATGNKFKLSPPRDFESERKEQAKKDLELLFDRKLFLGEIIRIFTHLENENKSISSIRELKFASPISYFSPLVINSLVKMSSNKDNIHKNEVLEYFRDIDWNEFIIRESYNNLIIQEECNFSEPQKEFISNWCYERVNNIDFQNAIVMKGDDFETSWTVIYLWFFLRKLQLKKYPKKKLLELVNFDWHGVGIDYLNEFLSFDEISERILHNIRHKKYTRLVLENYLKFCKKHKLQKALNWCIRLFMNDSFNEIIFKLSFEAMIEIGISNQRLYTLYRIVDSKRKWIIIHHLVNNNSKSIVNVLKDIIDNGNSEDKLRASKYLIKLNNNYGLIYFYNFVKNKSSYNFDSLGPDNIPSISKLSALPILLKLLALTYKKDFRDDKFNSLYRAVELALKNIASVNENNYKKVNYAMLRFIKTNHKTNENINYLHSFLARLEKEFLFSKSTTITIQEVQNKLKLLTV